MTPKQALKIAAWRTARQAEPGYFINSYFPNVINRREHWATKARRNKVQRGMGKLLLVNKGHTLPCMVVLTRYSASECDSDGLPMCFKALRDGIADAFGCDDSSKSPIAWIYKQEIAPRGCHGCRIEIK